ncbi:MAG: hypothetical protein C5S38_10205 [Candidatus Methanophagaceae archaeon]|nr:MAG: hypothetical protein C5S38_10205 [Methanophagales archaeon]
MLGGGMSIVSKIVTLIQKDTIFHIIVQLEYVPTMLRY